ncbi:Sec-independent protein translocase subunit TatA/TatB [Sphingobacterium paludis]|jgi:sec-independent protein translocase protein TatA|uniref:Sec-independent protein translocase protein TatA n=1 Tax=Sphingobacterium paludis TaxID=1476465 RepID=A0A4R7CX40_9SPHI|nr:twin-arginine translocase TatA/TatE family subunit [Sphingobacterium paludis]TDS12467.1 TatA/E family protein of Tat protein translocase [Sphingobacterium paludis]
MVGTLGFLNIGTQEMVLIVIVILLLFGGKKLPELARGLGKGIREFKDASEGIKREISDQINNFEKDLDVTADEQVADASVTVAEQEVKETGENLDVAEEEQLATKEEKKPLPTFSAPENTYQHNPGEQPATGDQHYTYGYNDHFAPEAPATDGESLVKKETEQPTKNA